MSREATWLKDKVSSPVEPGRPAQICYIDNVAVIASSALGGDNNHGRAGEWAHRLVSATPWMKLRGFSGSSVGTGNAGTSLGPSFGNLQRFSQVSRYQAPPLGRVMGQGSGECPKQCPLPFSPHWRPCFWHRARSLRESHHKSPREAQRARRAILSGTSEKQNGHIRKIAATSEKHSGRACDEHEGET